MKYSEKLYNQYKEEIESWDWVGLKTDALTNCYFNQCNEEVMTSTFIGTVMSLFPSGKYYMPWCTNQTIKDKIRDSAFQKALEDVADEYDCYVTHSDSDPCDMLIEFAVNMDRFKNHVQFVTNEEHRAYQEYIQTQV